MINQKPNASLLPLFGNAAVAGARSLVRRTVQFRAFGSIT